MEEIKKKLKQTDKNINKITKMLLKEARPKEQEKLQKDLIYQEGRFDAFMEIIKMQVV